MTRLQKEDSFMSATGPILSLRCGHSGTHGLGEVESAELGAVVGTRLAPEIGHEEE